MLILRNVTAGSVALAIWLLADGVTVVQTKMTQAEYLALGPSGVPSGSPGAGAVFLMALGGITALDTVDGYAHTGDAWIDPIRGPLIATSDNYDFGYFNLIASDPGATKISRRTGVRVQSSGNLFRPTILNAQVISSFDINSVPKSLTVSAVDDLIPNSKSSTFDSTAGGNGTASSSITVSGTVSVFKNRYIAALVATAGGGSPLATSPTWAGTALGATAVLDIAIDAFGARQTYWDLVNPASGIQNMVFNWNIAAESGCAFVAAYGVNQSNPRSTTNTAAANDNAPTLTLSGGAPGELAIVAVGNRGGVYTHDATWIADLTNNGWDPELQVAHKAGAASVTNTGSLSAAATWAMVGASIQAAAVAPVGGFIAPQLLW